MIVVDQILRTKLINIIIIVCVGGFLFSQELIAEFLVILKLSVMEKKELKKFDRFAILRIKIFPYPINSKSGTCHSLLSIFLIFICFVC